MDQQQKFEQGKQGKLKDPQILDSNQEMQKNQRNPLLRKIYNRPTNEQTNGSDSVRPTSKVSGSKNLNIKAYPGVKQKAKIILIPSTWIF